MTTAVERRLLSIFSAIAVVASASIFFERFEMDYLFIPCFIVCIIVGYLSNEMKDLSWNGFWFGFAVSMSCGCWIAGFNLFWSFTYLLLSIFISFFVGLFGWFVAFIGNTIKVCVF